jgi:dTMP kinase
VALFITIEGGEGAGKSAVSGELAARMTASGVDLVTTFEPGGTALGRELRSLLFREQPATMEPISPWTETFLFLAGRAHHVETVIRPTLARGGVVLCDRFADSTIAYQAYGRQLDLERVREVNLLATDGLQPNLTLFLDVPALEGLRRAHPEEQDRIGMETVEFHDRVLEGYRRLALAEPDRIRTIDAGQPLAHVIEEAWALISPRLIRLGYQISA